MSLKGILTSPVTWLAPLTFGLMLLFQNCAPPSTLHSKEMSSSDSFEIPMSKVLVHLDHDAGSPLTDVELYADDAVRSVKSTDPVTAIVSEAKLDRAVEFATSLAIRLAAPPDEKGSSYNLEIPIGSQKLIVARAKVYDTASGRFATYYGNTFAQFDQAAGEITIKLIALPSGQ